MRTGYLALWCLAASLILFCTMGFDKRRAKGRGRRINEATLFAWAILGGAPGGYLGMWFFRHKTRHLAFRWGFPFLAAAWLAGLYWLYQK